MTFKRSTEPFRPLLIQAEIDNNNWPELEITRRDAWLILVILAGTLVGTTGFFAALLWLAGVFE